MADLHAKYIYICIHKNLSRLYENASPHYGATWCCSICVPHSPNTKPVTECGHRSAGICKSRFATFFTAHQTSIICSMYARCVRALPVFVCPVFHNQHHHTTISTNGEPILSRYPHMLQMGYQGDILCLRSPITKRIDNITADAMTTRSCCWWWCARRLLISKAC